MKRSQFMSMILWCCAIISIPVMSQASLQDPFTTIELDTPVHFLAAEGSDVVVQPGTYTIEAAEEWLRVIPGERRDELLLEAHHTQHGKALQAPKAVMQFDEQNEILIVLLLPGGQGLEAIGSVSGIRSRAVNRQRTSQTRTRQQQATRIPTQTKQSAVSPQSKPLPKSPAQPHDSLVQRIQTLEQQVSTLLATIDSLQNRLATIESAVQVSNSGQVTVQGTTVKLNASMVDVQAGTSKFSGVVQADTLITNSVVSSSYTPGAGNIW